MTVKCDQGYDGGSTENPEGYNLCMGLNTHLLQSANHCICKIYALLRKDIASEIAKGKSSLSGWGEELLVERQEPDMRREALGQIGWKSRARRMGVEERILRSCGLQFIFNEEHK